MNDEEPEDYFYEEIDYIHEPYDEEIVYKPSDSDEEWNVVHYGNDKIKVSTKGKFHPVDSSGNTIITPWLNTSITVQGRPFDKYINLSNGKTVELKKCIWEAYYRTPVPQNKDVLFLTAPKVRIPDNCWHVSNLFLANKV